MDYLHKQIEERRLQRRALEREIGEAEAAAVRARAKLAKIDDELTLLFDLDNHRAEIEPVSTQFARVTAPQETPSAYMNAPVARPRWLDRLSDAWKGYYESLLDIGPEFTTDDLVALVPNPPPRKTIRGTLGKHVDSGYLIRPEHGRFRFVFDEEHDAKTAASTKPAAEIGSSEAPANHDEGGASKLQEEED